MARKDKIKELIKEEKAPGSRRYLVLFLIAAAIFLLGYFAVAVFQGSSPAKVTNEAEAGRAASGLGKNLQNASSALGDIEEILG